jgi:hypothetical protein
MMGSSVKEALSDAGVSELAEKGDFSSLIGVTSYAGLTGDRSFRKQTSLWLPVEP